ncbi:MAG: hypothetical protein CXT66_06465 [Methanobacteriota archaeon]|jgi:hypothetical protein|nr:MAG: hypothetical protein CXT66_06465 [Euryarchaeota archaeon]
MVISETPSFSPVDTLNLGTPLVPEESGEKASTALLLAFLMILQLAAGLSPNPDEVTEFRMRLENEGEMG